MTMAAFVFHRPLLIHYRCYRLQVLGVDATPVITEMIEL